MIKVGFDFDNTIINYDNLFHEISLKKGLIPKRVGKSKESIKNFLTKNYPINIWQKIQSEVYSQLIYLAKPNNEIIKLIKYLTKNNIEVFIVSHKTKFPYFGNKINLHKLSLKWIDKNILSKKIKIQKKNIFFETTEKKKINKIKKLKLTHFIDDLDKILKLLDNSIKKIKYTNHFSFQITKDKYFHIKNLNLKRGRNNKVNYSKIDNEEFLIKNYKEDYITKYTRDETEYKFVNFLQKKKIKNISKIVKYNPNEKKILFEFIEGKKIKKVSKSNLNSCIRFIKRINNKTTIKNFRFQFASDACKTFYDHLICFENRYKNIIKLNRKKTNKKVLKLLNQINSEYKFILKNNNIKKGLYKKILIKNLILSPSDFGFHNSLFRNNKLFFFDFEYAGWDDPIKLMCDFILNPDYKISSKNEIFFIEKFKKNFPNINFNTYYIFKKIHFLKWICVIMGYIYRDNQMNYDYIYKANWYYNKFKNRHLNTNIRYNIKK